MESPTKSSPAPSKSIFPHFTIPHPAFFRISLFWLPKKAEHLRELDLSSDLLIIKLLKYVHCEQPKTYT